jgi:outer membrane biosynthesis protein TonB
MLILIVGVKTFWYKKNMKRLICLFTVLIAFTHCSKKEPVDPYEAELAQLAQLNLDLEQTGEDQLLAGSIRTNIIFNSQKIDDCYKQEVKNNQVGKVVVNFVISRKGKVIRFKVPRTDIPNLSFNACIEKVFRAMSFPLANKPFDVTYTFNFTREK